MARTNHAANAESPSFAVLLRRYRIAAGLSQEELAERAGLSRRGISDLERGQRRRPHLATVRRIAEALDLDERVRVALLGAASSLPRASDGSLATFSPVSEWPQHNLPIQLTGFIGRTRELEALPQLLTAAHLLTVTGAGGIGKTRLALEMGRQIISAYADGVWYVELAALADAALVPSAIAAVLRLRVDPQSSIQHALTTYLRFRCLLLILDNCEHLVSTCAAVALALLRDCPNLRILATSREPLGVSGETTWRLESLSMPTAREAALASGARADAVQLFVERARAAQPGFVLSEDNAPALARICRGLDGIPLAIELAAMRIRVLSVEQISSMLTHTLPLLSSGNRLAPPRHSTLRAALEWSYRLLSNTEQYFFAHLAVFSGGWSLEAAAELAAGDGIERSDALNLLSGLVEKSLVTVDPLKDGTLRYRLLEPIRQYAQELLESTDSAERVRDSCVEYFIALGERAEPHLLGGPRTAEWLDRLEPEQANLRAALHRCIERADSERGLRLGGAVWRWWYERGTFREGREWLDLLLQVAHGWSRTTLRGRVLSGAGVLACLQHDFDPAQTMLEEAREIFIQLHDVVGDAECLHNLAFLAEHREDYANARGLYAQALDMFRANGNRIGEALTLNNLAWSLLEEGDHTAARDISSMSVARYLELDDVLGAAWPKLALGFALLHSGDIGRGDAVFRETLAILRGRAWPPRDEMFPACVEGLAASAACRQQADRAVLLAAAAAHVRDDLGRALNESEAGMAVPWLEPVYQVMDTQRRGVLRTEAQSWSLDELVVYALDESDSNRANIRRSRASG